MAGLGEGVGVQTQKIFNGLEYFKRKIITMSRLRYEENTCFTHDLWDRYDFLGTLRLESDLWVRDDRQRENYGYSLIQDCYYALAGREIRHIKNNKTVGIWENVTQSNLFEKCQEVFGQGMIGKISALRTLSDFIEKALTVKPKPKPIQQSQPGQSQNNQGQQNANGSKNNNQPQDQGVPQVQEREPNGSNQGNSPLPDSSQSPSSVGPDSVTSPMAGGNNATQGSANQTISGGEIVQGLSQELADEQREGSGQGSGAGNNLIEGPAPADNSPSQHGGFGLGSSVNSMTNVVGYLSQDDLVNLDEQEDEGEPEIFSDPGPQEVEFEEADFKVNQKGEFIHNRKLERAMIDPQEYKEILESIMPFVNGENTGEVIQAATKVASKINIKNLEKFLGFARRSTHAAKAEGVSAVGELTKYKNVVWSENLHPVDMAGIARRDPLTRVRMAEGNLRSRQYKDVSPQGRGPVIVLRDESGSMEGDKHLRSKELEVALAVAFNEQDRELISVPWDHVSTRIWTYGSSKNDRNFEEHLNSFLGGGTSVIHAIATATVYAKEYVKGADMLIITDGEISESPNAIADACKPFKESYGGRIWLCFVLPGSHHAKEIDRHKVWADGIININEIDESDALFKMLQQANTGLEGSKTRL